MPASGGPTRPRPPTVDRAVTTHDDGPGGLDGTLGFAGERRVVNGLVGTLTGLPKPGKVLDRGDRLYELDGRRRPILFYGARPAWRTLEDGVARRRHHPTRGEPEGARLHPQGRRHRRRMGRRDDRAVKRWQRATGQTIDGVVELGEVVFLPGAVRVTELPPSWVQRRPGTPILSGTTDERVVTVDLPADRTDIVKVGDAVEIELADGSRTPGTIDAIGTVAESGTDAFGNPVRRR